MRFDFRSLITIWLSLTLAGIVIVGLGGCSETSTLIQPETYLKTTFATPDALMAEFVEAYGSRDLAAYAALLHEDFLYSFNPHSSRNHGPMYEFFTREDELICAGNLFSGEPVINSRGQTVPAITAIEFENWRQVGDWELCAPGEGDGLRGVFECAVRFRRGEHGDMVVRGRQLFTVTMADISDEEGAVAPHYQIIGWQDLTR